MQSISSVHQQADGQSTSPASHSLGYTLTNFGGNIGIGHAGIGGSLGFCLPSHEIAVGIVVNRLSFAQLVGEVDISQQIVQTICETLGVPALVTK